MVIYGAGAHTLTLENVGTRYAVVGIRMLVDSITGKKGSDGSTTVQFGGCDGVANCSPIVKGWNYTVRLYRPRAEILSGKWQFPEAKPVG